MMRGPITRLALRFLALTAVRPSELRGARWDEFEDLERHRAALAHSRRHE